MLSVVSQGSILLNILKNPWFTRFPLQIMAFLIALRIKFVYSKKKFESSSHTGNMLQVTLQSKKLILN